MTQIDPPSATTLQRSFNCITDNITIVWLNSDVIERNSITELHRSFKFVRTFDMHTPCLKSLKDTNDQKVFLILSDTFTESFIPLVHDMLQVASIHILSDNKVKYGQLPKEWKKIKGVFDNISFIYVRLLQSIESWKNDFSPISIISPSSIIDLNELDPSFMYTKLLKEIFLDTAYDEQAKIEFIQFSRSQNVTVRSCAFEDFERDFEYRSPIWWYTKEPFIYSLINRALRTQNVETLLKMGFFVQKLHRDIEQTHTKTKAIETQVIYRGQGISDTELEKLQVTFIGFRFTRP